MPTQYIPISESEQQFASLIDRIFTEKDFAKLMETNPTVALQKAGYKLTAAQKRKIKNAQLLPLPDRELVAASGIISKVLTTPAVRVITKGTKPAVSVITKGTQPAVSVAVKTVIAVEPAKEPTLTTTTGGTLKPKRRKRK